MKPATEDTRTMDLSITFAEDSLDLGVWRRYTLAMRVKYMTPVRLTSMILADIGLRWRQYLKEMLLETSLLLL